MTAVADRSRRRVAPADGGDLVDRALPQVIEAEQAVLGSLMSAPALLPDVARLLNADDFYRPAHQVIYETMVRLHGQGAPTDPAAVGSSMQIAGVLDRCGGVAYLHDLWDRARPGGALFYAGLVRETAVRRNIVHYHMRGAQQAQDGSGLSLPEIIDAAYSGLDEASQTRESHEVLTAGETLADTLDHVESLKGRAGATGLSTGFSDLDALTSGLHPGQMVVVAARPGIGKSTLGLDFVRTASLRHGLPTLTFTLEMSRQELTLRLIAAHCRVKMHQLRSGQLSERDWEQIGAKTAELAEAPIYIDDTPNITMADIRAKAHRLRQRVGLSLIVIDYLQLMVGDRRAESRQQEVSEISRGCKILAKELDVPVVAISQLNRGPETRADRKPQLSDLRESGSIEQDADVVLLLWREDAYNPETENAGKAEILIAKQRSGPVGRVDVTFQGDFCRMTNWVSEHGVDSHRTGLR